MLKDLVAIGCLVWYLTVILVSVIGVVQIRRSYASKPSNPESTAGLRATCPHVTIIRPVKGLEPCLFECLAATFSQNYPKDKLTIFLCISSRSDPALPILENLLTQHNGFDAEILAEDEDPNLSGQDGDTLNLGPNPKIRNMSRAYREAKGDIVWVIDCNVWVGPDVAGRMVDSLCGFTPPSPKQSTPKPKKFKFVHQLPLVMDITDTSSSTQSNQSLFSKAGGLLEELFLSTSHAKFYTAINTVAVAPCIVGKSNMFRRSHLDALTSPYSPLPVKSTASVPQAQQKLPGIDYFSSNICEDHLIGDLLWKNPVPSHVHSHARSEGATESQNWEQGLWNDWWGREWGHHAYLPPHPSNLAIQPTASLSLQSYLSRRVRWLRVRKFTVTAATLVEPGTESLLCSLYGAYAISTLPFFQASGVPGTWTAFCAFWLLSVALWAAADRWVYGMLQDGGAAGGGDRGVPFQRKERRGLGEWLCAWIAREALAFPIWAWAFFGGVSVVWRGRSFRVGVDMRVREIIGEPSMKHKGA